MKLILGLSTSFKKLKIVVSDGKRYLNYSKEHLNQEEIIFKKINEMLKKFKRDFSSISTICSVTGPGRFTGMRISYTISSVYSALKKTELFGVRVSDVLAYNCLETLKKENLKKDIAVLTHAFKDEFYLSFYRYDGKKIKRNSEIFWLKDYLIKEKLKNFKGIIIGDKEDHKEIYDLIEDKSLIAKENISKIISENIIKASLYFKYNDLKPIYIKKAKYEML